MLDTLKDFQVLGKRVTHTVHYERTFRFYFDNTVRFLICCVSPRSIADALGRKFAVQGVFDF